MSDHTALARRLKRSEDIIDMDSGIMVEYQKVLKDQERKLDAVTALIPKWETDGNDPDRDQFIEDLREALA